MKDFFNLNNRVWIEIGKTWDYIVLNFLWVVCSIPIVTIGAATSAMNFASLRLLSDNGEGVLKDFFSAFRDNFKQATLLWLIMCAVFAFLSIDISLCMRYAELSSTVMAVVLIMLFVFVVLFLAVLIYLFPIQCWFENTLFKTLQNAVALCIHHFGFTLLLLAADALMLLFAMAVPGVLVLLPGMMSFVHGLVFRHIFRKYIPQDS